MVMLCKELTVLLPNQLLFLIVIKPWVATAHNVFLDTTQIMASVNMQTRSVQLISKLQEYV